MPDTHRVIAFPLRAVDDSELRTRYWELVFEGRRDSEDARAIEAELVRRGQRPGPSPGR